MSVIIDWLVKIYKKKESNKKVLTKVEASGKIDKLSERARPRKLKKKVKKLKKVSKKVLTSGRECDRILRLSRKDGESVIEN